MRALIERGRASLFRLRGGWLTLAVALPLTFAGGLWLISPPPAQESVRSDRLRQQWLKLLPLRVVLAREEVAGPAERVFPASSAGRWGGANCLEARRKRRGDGA